MKFRDSARDISTKCEMWIIWFYCCGLFQWYKIAFFNQVIVLFCSPHYLGECNTHLSNEEQTKQTIAQGILIYICINNIYKNFEAVMTKT